MADDYNIIDKSGKLIFDDVDRKENDTLIISRNMDPAEEKSEEDRSTPVVRQDDSIQSIPSPQMKTLEEINNKSEVVENDEATSSPSKVTENVGISTIIEDGQKAVELAQHADVDPPKPNKLTRSLEEVSDMHRESKKDNNEEEIKGELKDEIPPKPSMLNDSSEEKNNVHSEPMKNNAEITEKLKNYIPANPGEINGSSEEVNEAQSEPKKNDPKISNKEENKEELKNDTPTKPNKPNDSSEEVSKVQSEPKQNDPEMSNKVEINEQSNIDTSARSDKQNDSVNILKVNQVTSSSSVEGMEAKNNKVVEQESNKKEAMVLSSSVRTSEDGITINVKEPEEAVNFEK